MIINKLMCRGGILLRNFVNACILFDFEHVVEFVCSFGVGSGSNAPRVISWNFQNCSFHVSSFSFCVP